MLHKATVPGPGDVGLDPPPQLGDLEVEEDEEGAEEAPQDPQHDAGDDGEDVDVNPVLNLEEDVLFGGELAET